MHIIHLYRYTVCIHIGGTEKELAILSHCCTVAWTWKASIMGFVPPQTRASGPDILTPCTMYQPSQSASKAPRLPCGPSMIAPDEKVPPLHESRATCNILQLLVESCWFQSCQTPGRYVKDVCCQDGPSDPRELELSMRRIVGVLLFQLECVET